MELTQDPQSAAAPREGDGMKKLNINAIVTDGGTQSRVEINNETVADYAECIRAGVEFPPIVVFHDGADYWLADGFHRYHAHKHADKASIAADVRVGTKREAVLFSLGANGTHGLRRTNADKRKAAQTLLNDPEWAAWSQEKIAKVCRVSAGFVSKLVNESASLHGEEMKPTVRTVERAGKTYQQDTSRIGKSAPARAPAPVAEKAAKRSINENAADVPELGEDHKLTELHDTINELAAENEQLRDKLAVESMDATEAAKTEAADTIRDLRAQVKALQAELEAVKSSRDTYMREAEEAKKQVISWRKKAEKAGAAA